MSDELKSAWEIAMEKLEGQEEMAVEKLTDEQKKEIAEIRSKYKARIAEAEINTDSKIKSAVETGAYDQVEVVREQLVQEKNRLNRDMEKEIEKIRKSGA